MLLTSIEIITNIWQTKDKQMNENTFILEQKLKIYIDLFLA